MQSTLRIAYLPTVQILSGLSKFSTFKIAKNLDIQISDILCEKIRYLKISRLFFTHSVYKKKMQPSVPVHNFLL